MEKNLRIKKDATLFGRFSAIREKVIPATLNVVPSVATLTGVGKIPRDAGESFSVPVLYIFLSNLISVKQNNTGNNTFLLFKVVIHGMKVLKGKTKKYSR